MSRITPFYGHFMKIFTTNCSIDFCLFNFFIFYLFFFFFKLEKREKVSTLQKVKNFGTNLFCSAKKLFCSVNFFSAKFFFLYFGKGKSFRAHKNFGGKKFTEQKSFFAEQKRLSQKFCVVFFSSAIEKRYSRGGQPKLVLGPHRKTILSGPRVGQPCSKALTEISIKK